MKNINPISDSIKIIDRNCITDSRGWFLKVITGNEEFIQSHVGEVYIVSALPGESRGGHYHLKALEWFTLIQGKANLLLEDIVTHEKLKLTLDVNRPQTIMVPPNIAHCFENANNEPFLVVAYTNEQYNPTDTLPFLIS